MKLENLTCTSSCVIRGELHVFKEITPRDLTYKLRGQEKKKRKKEKKNWFLALIKSMISTRESCYQWSCTSKSFGKWIDCISEREEFMRGCNASPCWSESWPSGYRHCQRTQCLADCEFESWSCLIDFHWHTILPSLWARRWCAWRST